MNNTENAVTIYLNKSEGQHTVPNSKGWTNSIGIPSSSSNNVYVVAQHETKRHWGCSCPGWKRYRHCKHLKALMLPAGEKPFEAKIVG